MNGWYLVNLFFKTSYISKQLYKSNPKNIAIKIYSTSFHTLFSIALALFYELDKKKIEEKLQTIRILSENEF